MTSAASISSCRTLVIRGRSANLIGKPFNGQAKGLLWLTWRSYAGPPQYFIPPEGESPQPACKAKADHRQNPWRPGPKGPAAPSTLARESGRQPSGIQESTAQVPVPISNAPQAPEPSRPYGRVPQSFAAALAFRQSSTSFLPKSPCSCSNLATTGAVASCQRWISSFGIT